jgi:hypothetical protein
MRSSSLSRTTPTWQDNLARWLARWCKDRMRVSHRAFLRHVEKARWWVPGRHMGGDGLHSNVHTLHDYLQLALMLRHPDLQIPHAAQGPCLFRIRERWGSDK